jgi:hypothetical protein
MLMCTTLFKFIHNCTAAGFFMTLKACELVLTASANVIGAKMLNKSISETIHGVSGHEIYDMHLTLPCVPGLAGKFGASKTSSSPHNVVFPFCERAP